MRGKVYFVCDTFLNLTWYVSKYLQLRSLLDEFTENIDEKVCELVGFYVWYNKKVLGLDKVLG